MTYLSFNGDPFKIRTIDTTSYKKRSRSRNLFRHRPAMTTGVETLSHTNGVAEEKISTAGSLTGIDVV